MLLENNGPFLPTRSRKEQSGPKANRRESVMQIRAEISEIENG